MKEGLTMSLSNAIERYLRRLDDAGLSTHNVLIARGDDILFEKYYPPFTADFLHREYSQSKSIVSLAVGFAYTEGLISLDDPIGKYFPDETNGVKDPKMAEQTIRNMLMMSTPKHAINWFNARTPDRVRQYFETTTTAAPLGSEFQYDSPGSFVLGAMVEQLSGMSLTEYLRPRLFDKLGVSAGIHCLKCPGGHSWGDSAFLATARDMMKLLRFVMDGGRVNGEQLIDAGYMRDAVKPLIPTIPAESAHRRSSQGYGYLIWKLYGEGFYFNGMGCQFSVAVPEKDLILIYNGDNQGIGTAGDTVIDSFYDIVVPAVDESDDSSARVSLETYASGLKLMSARGLNSSPLEKKISGKRYTLDENPMGIKWLELTFGETCKMSYENAQGMKEFAFGRCENLYALFPEEGYYREVGTVFCPGSYYKTAFSGAWKDSKTLLIDVQAIDEYFGRLWITLGFDGDKISVNMFKSAEDFFTTYSGKAEGKMV